MVISNQHYIYFNYKENLPVNYYYYFITITSFSSLYDLAEINYKIPLCFKFRWMTKSVTADNTNRIELVSVAHVR